MSKTQQQILAQEAANVVLSKAQSGIGEIHNDTNPPASVAPQQDNPNLVREFQERRETFLKRISAIKPEYLSSVDAATLNRVLEIINDERSVEEKIRILDAIANPDTKLSEYVKALDANARDGRKSFYRRTKEEHQASLRGFTALSQTAKVITLLSDIDDIISDLEDETIPLEHRKVLQQILNSYCNSGDLKVVLPWIPKTANNGQLEDFKYDVRLGGLSELWKLEGRGFWDYNLASSLYQDVSLWSEHRATLETSLNVDSAKLASCIAPSVPYNMNGFKEGFIDRFTKFAKKKLGSVSAQKKQKIEESIKLMVELKDSIVSDADVATYRLVAANTAAQIISNIYGEQHGFVNLLETAAQDAELSEIISINEDFASQVKAENDSDASRKLQSIIEGEFASIDLTALRLQEYDTAEKLSAHLIKTSSNGRGLVGFFENLSDKRDFRRALHIPSDARAYVLYKNLGQQGIAIEYKVVQKLIKTFCDQNPYHPRFANQITDAIKVAHMINMLGEPVINFSQDDVLDQIQQRISEKNPQELEVVNNGLKAIAKMIGPDMEKELSSLKKQNPVTLLKKLGDIKIFDDITKKVLIYKENLLSVEQGFTVDYVARLSAFEDLALSYDAAIFRKKCADLLQVVKRDYEALRFDIVQKRIFVDATNTVGSDRSKELESVKTGAFEGFDDIASLCELGSSDHLLAIDRKVEELSLIQKKAVSVSPYLELGKSPSEEEFLALKSLYEEVSQIIITADKTLSNSFKRFDLQGINKVSRRELFILYRDYILSVQTYLSNPQNYDFIAVGRGAPDIKLDEVRNKVIKYLKDSGIETTAQTSRQNKFHETELEIKFLLGEFDLGSAAFKPFEYPSEEKIMALETMYNQLAAKALKKYVKEKVDRQSDIVALESEIDSFANGASSETKNLTALFHKFQKTGLRIVKSSTTNAAKFNSIHKEIEAIFNLFINFEQKQKAGLLKSSLAQCGLKEDDGKVVVADKLKTLLSSIVVIDREIRDEITEDLADIGVEAFIEKYKEEISKLVEADLRTREGAIEILQPLKFRIEEVTSVITARSKAEDLDAKRKANSRSRYRDPLKSSSREIVLGISKQNAVLNRALEAIIETSAKYSADARETYIYQRAVSTQENVVYVIELYESNIEKLLQLKLKIERDLVRRARTEGKTIQDVVSANKDNFINGLEAEIARLKPNAGGANLLEMAALTSEVESLKQQNKEISERLTAIQLEKQGLEAENVRLLSLNQELQRRLDSLATVEERNQVLAEENARLFSLNQHLQNTINEQTETLSKLQQRNDELEAVNARSQREDGFAPRITSGSISPRVASHVVNTRDRWIVKKCADLSQKPDFDSFVKNVREFISSYDDKMIKVVGNEIAVNETLYNKKMEEFTTIGLIRQNFETHGKSGNITAQEVTDALERINKTRKTKGIIELVIDNAGVVVQKLEQEENIKLDETMLCVQRYISFKGERKEVNASRASAVITM